MASTGVLDAGGTPAELVPEETIVVALLGVSDGGSSSTAAPRCRSTVAVAAEIRSLAERAFVSAATAVLLEVVIFVAEVALRLLPPLVPALLVLMPFRASAAD